MSRNFTGEERKRILEQYDEVNNLRFNEESVVYRHNNAHPTSINNDKSLAKHDYNKVFNQNSQLSLHQEPGLSYEQRYSFLTIDSQDRDAINYPSVNNYSVHFAETYKNVTCIEMISATIPNQAASGSVLDEGYLIIDIPELNNMEFTKNGQNKGFTILPLKNPTSGPSGGFIVPELSCMFKTPLILKTPLASLSRITIKVKGRDGSLFNFGEPSGSMDKQFQNCFTFKITTSEKNRNSLQTRNVY